MTTFTLEDLNAARLRSSIKEVWLGAEVLHFLISNESDRDMVQWTADRFVDLAADLKRLCEEVHPADEED